MNNAKKNKGLQTQVCQLNKTIEIQRSENEEFFNKQKQIEDQIESRIRQDADEKRAMTEKVRMLEDEFEKKKKERELEIRQHEMVAEKKKKSFIQKLGFRVNSSIKSQESAMEVEQSSNYQYRKSNESSVTSFGPMDVVSREELPSTVQQNLNIPKPEYSHQSSFGATPTHIERKDIIGCEEHIAPDLYSSNIPSSIPTKCTIQQQSMPAKSTISFEDTKDTQRFGPPEPPQRRPDPRTQNHGHPNRNVKNKF